MSQKEMREIIDNLEFCTLKETDYRAKNKFGLMNGPMNDITCGQEVRLTRCLRVTNYMNDLQFEILHSIKPAFT